MATVHSVALVIQTVFGLRSVITDFLNHTQVPGPLMASLLILYAVCATERALKFG